jgi:hypothetical protein
MPSNHSRKDEAANSFDAQSSQRIDKSEGGKGGIPQGGFLRKARERGERPMRLIRSVRRSVVFAMIGLVGLMVGCSGGAGEGQSVTPPDKETSKKIADEMKSAQKDRMKAMGGLKGGGRR